MRQDVAEKLLGIIKAIDDFEKQTQADEYTDVGDAWELLYRIRMTLGDLRVGEAGK
jgi:hypothetical protein